MDTDNRLQRWQLLSGSGLKMLAVVTMLIDHTAAVILEYGLYPAGRMTDALWELDRAMRVIGRLAFPLYIVLLMEGFFHTRSRAKYLLRLSAFALISEIPFDLAFPMRRVTAVPGLLYQNVFFTLALGFTVCWLCEEALTRSGQPARFTDFGPREALTLPKAAAWALCAVIVYLGVTAAEVLRTDYAGYGVAAICAAWLIRRYTDKAAWEYAGILPVLIFLSWSELAAAAALWPVCCYRGRKGRGGNKWLWYLFYPVHLLILAGVRMIVCR